MDSEDSFSPTWSLDGQRIAFSFREEDSDDIDIQIMNADGAGVSWLTKDGSGSQPDWSPDGCRSAFSLEREENRDVYIMNADGSNVTGLTNHPENDSVPAWSPNGRQIVFAAKRDSYDKIYVMNADGSQQTSLTRQHGHLWSCLVAGRTSHNIQRIYTIVLRYM